MSDTYPAAWFCGAFQPTALDLMPYQCTEPSGHCGDHRAAIDARVVAQWPRAIHEGMCAGQHDRDDRNHEPPVCTRCGLTWEDPPREAK